MQHAMPLRATVIDESPISPSSSNGGGGGVDALYFSVLTPANQKETLQFQWMRLHPMTLIAMSDSIVPEEGHAPPAPDASIRVAKMFHRHRQAIRNSKKDPTTLSSTFPPPPPTHNNRSDDSVARFRDMSPFIRASGVGVDLSELFDPPLLSTSVPTFGSFHDQEEHRSAAQQITKTDSSVTSVPEMADDNKMKINIVEQALEQLASSALLEMGKRDSADESVANLNTVQALSSILTSESLVHLSSNLHGFLTKKFEEYAATCSLSTSWESSSRAKFLMFSLILLAELGTNENMGRHILQVLAPLFLQDCNELLVQVNPSKSSSSSIATQLLFQRLAQALVTNCSLANLTKRELWQLMPNIDDDDDHNDDEGEKGRASDALRELYCCLGEAYSAAKRFR